MKSKPKDVPVVAPRLFCEVYEAAVVGMHKLDPTAYAVVMGDHELRFTDHPVNQLLFSMGHYLEGIDRREIHQQMFLRMLAMFKAIPLLSPRWFGPSDRDGVAVDECVIAACATCRLPYRTLKFGIKLLEKEAAEYEAAIPVSGMARRMK